MYSQNNTCGECKYMKQYKHCSGCINPAQNNASLRKYVYYNFRCPLFTKGVHWSRMSLKLLIIYVFAKFRR